MQLKLYLIEILHQTTTGSNATLVEHGCILSKFYIKPQQCLGRNREDMGCILSKFYIKPQLLYELILEMNVVSYRNSTSNHNLQPILYSLDKVVSYRNSTSNHNGDADLHHSGRVVSYRNSTSNHNLAGRGAERQALYLIEILHQTTTLGLIWTTTKSCILSKFYIKPQLPQKRRKRNGVVSYRNSTSNHNWKSFIVCNLVLYLIEILHQTTTAGGAGRTRKRLYLIEILHQTTTSLFCYTNTYCCILSKFYIKPQLCP